MNYGQLSVRENYHVAFISYFPDYVFLLTGRLNIIIMLMMIMIMIIITIKSDSSISVVVIFIHLLNCSFSNRVYEIVCKRNKNPAEAVVHHVFKRCISMRENLYSSL